MSERDEGVERTEEWWAAFIESHQVKGGVVARIPVGVHVHCRRCPRRLSRDEPVELYQLYYTQEDSSSIFCIPCARELPQTVKRAEPRRALWMQYEPETVMEARRMTY